MIKKNYVVVSSNRVRIREIYINYCIKNNNHHICIVANDTIYCCYEYLNFSLNVQDLSSNLLLIRIQFIKINGHGSLPRLVCTEI